MTAKSGYGLALLMVFLATSVLIGSSLGIMLAPSSVNALNINRQDVINADYLADAALDALKDDMQTRLNAGEALTTAGYRFPISGTNALQMPIDPLNLAAGNQTVGTYYGTLTLARGITYIANVQVTVNGKTYSKSELFQMNNNATSVSGSTSTCAGLEAAVFAGNLASVPDADLIKYAQDGCMIKTEVAPTITAPTAPSGGSTCSSSTSYSGSSSPQEVSSTSSGCVATFNGNVGTINVGSNIDSSSLSFTRNLAQVLNLGDLKWSVFDASSTATGKTIKISSVEAGATRYTATASGCLSVISASASGATFKNTGNCTGIGTTSTTFTGGDATPSSIIMFPNATITAGSHVPGGTQSLTVAGSAGTGGSATWTLADSASPYATATAKGTTGADTITVNGVCTGCKLDTAGGGDTLAINNTLSNGTITVSKAAGDTAATENKTFVRTLGASTTDTATIDAANTTGKNYIYFDDVMKGTINGGSGYNIFACTASAYGTGSRCGTANSFGLYYIQRLTINSKGNDIISIDNGVGSSGSNKSNFNFTAGHSILYTKYISYYNINWGSTTKNLVIIKDKNNFYCSGMSASTITGSTDNVLLLPTGSSACTNFTNKFLKIVYY